MPRLLDRGPRPRLPSFWLVVVLLAVHPPLASAGPAILLESHAGERPAEAAAHLRQLLAGLRGAQPLHGRLLREEIERRLSRSAGRDAQRAALRSAVEEGGRLFIEGEYAAAITQLERALDGLLSETARLLADRSLRDTLHRALLFLAHAHLRAGQPERAVERVGEVVRSFPDRDLGLVQMQYGPELVSLYRKVRQDLDRQRRGSLQVTSDPPGCMVFVDERLVGVSPARVPDLYPGRYRVLLLRDERPGRVHLVTVEGGEQSIRIRYQLDRALRTDGYVGFRFDDPATLERDEITLAAEVGRALEAEAVLVIGYRRHQGRRALVGSRVSPGSGRLIRSAMVAVDPAAPSSQTVAALARFLLDGQGDAGLIIHEPGPGPVAAQPAGFFSARVWKWVTFGLAIGAAAAGAGLLAIHGRGTCDDAGRRCPETHDTRTAGIVLATGAGLAAASSGFLFYWDQRTRAAQVRAGLLPWIGRELGLAAALSY